MGPPSDNIEFFQSEHFKAALKGRTALSEALLAHLRTWPGAGVEIAPGIRELSFRWEGRDLVLLYRRVAQRLGLMYVMEMPRQRDLLEEARADLRRRYGSH